MNHNNSLERLIGNAKRKCLGLYTPDYFKMFHLIYPFTTENIAGYISEFDLKNKSLLTVGSSGDQIINAALFGCNNITLFDINPYVKFYYYLKIACLLELNRHEFLEFLRYKDYPKVFYDNKETFNLNTYIKVFKTLSLLDYNSFLFWDSLFQEFSPKVIRTSLFNMDENRTNVITSCNPYLSSEIAYLETREKVKKLIPEFITGDILLNSLSFSYDNIWLSNIAVWMNHDYLREIMQKITMYLNPEGKLLITYLYQTTEDTEYESDWSPIYNLPITLDILREYKPQFITFPSVDSFKFNDDTIKDSVLIYKKTLTK